MRPNTSKIRTAAGIALIATATLACVGFMVAHLVGDQTPPYEPPLANLAWSLFMTFSAASLLLGLLHIGWLISDRNRRA
jgi:hypothetical protein